MTDAPLSSVEEQILMCVLAEIEVMPSIPGSPQRNHRIREYRKRGIRYRPSAWRGHSLSVAERQRYSRATWRLVERGLLERDTECERDRVAFLRPTPQGLAVAMELAGVDANLPDLAVSLAQTSWGTTLLDPPKFDDSEMPELMDIEWPPEM